MWAMQPLWRSTPLHDNAQSYRAMEAVVFQSNLNIFQGVTKAFPDIAECSYQSLHISYVEKRNVRKSMKVYL